MSVVNKRLYPETINVINYLDVRFFLIATMVIPMMVIQVMEKILLGSALSVSALMLIFLDLIFNIFGVGHFDLVNDNPHYYFMANFYSITSYVFILLSLLFEKNLSDKGLDMVRLYHTPFWLSDLSKQGIVSTEDQKWMVNTILPEAISQGLRKIANIYYDGQPNEDYRNRIKETTLKLGAEIEFFTDRKRAEEWVDSFIETVVNPI